MIYHVFSQRHAMSKRALYPISAAFLVLGIFLWSNLLKPSPWIGDIPVASPETNVLAATENPVDTAAEVGLTVKIPKQSDTLSFSTQAEVLRFSLRAEGPYTLRYLTMQIEASGLKPIPDWTVYKMKGGQIDFSESVGYGETQIDGFVRLRLFSSRSAAYLGESGEQEFAVLASVLKDPAAPAATVSLSLPQELPPETDWAWLPGSHGETWLSVGESLGAADVLGLPTKSIQKE